MRILVPGATVHSFIGNSKKETNLRFLITVSTIVIYKTIISLLPLSYLYIHHTIYICNILYFSFLLWYVTLFCTICKLSTDYLFTFLKTFFVKCTRKIWSDRVIWHNNQWESVCKSTEPKLGHSSQRVRVIVPEYTFVWKMVGIWYYLISPFFVWHRGLWFTYWFYIII